MDFGQYHQPNRPVNAAIESKIGILGIHGIAGGIADGDRQMVFTSFQVFRYVETEPAVAPVMFPDEMTVQRHFGGSGHTVKLQVDLFIRLLFRRIKAFFIHAFAPPVIAAAILAVLSVPCMG